MVNAQLPSSRFLWLRWSWRDLRHHWVAVITIALVMAIGIGVFAGLGSTATWRRLSNDASFDTLAMHDLQVSLSPGTFVPEGTLTEVAAGIAAADTIEASAERLVVDSQLDASSGGDSILVAARLVGMDLAAPPAVDRVWIQTAPDTGASDGGTSAILEAKFADHWALPPSGTVTLAGNRDIGYQGLGIIPEDFFYEGPEGSIFSQGELAPLYLPLSVAQDVAAKPGQINDLVLTLVDGADRDLVEQQLIDGIDRGGIGATVSTADDATAVRVLYEDIENDQRFWNILAGLVLAAAALAAFNLVSRIVEAQRREIGIGMALGMARSKLAIRPLLVGLQVALLGTAAGVGVGLWVGSAMRRLLESFLPLPIYTTPFQLGLYGQAAALGLAIPILASAFPVWRAVRVEPIEAIRTGHLTARTSTVADWTGRLHLPGASLTKMPIRNVLRTPRRTLLTAVGIGAAITALVAVLGMLDSVGRTIDRMGAELEQANGDRIFLQLDTFHRIDSDVIGAVVDLPETGVVDPLLRLPVTAQGSDGADLELIVDVLDLETDTWTPTLLVARPDRGDQAGAIIISQKAADDLGVAVGDPIRIRHPRRSADGTFELATSPVEVSGIHANPLRAFAYMPIDGAELFGLAGTANVLNVYPATGVTGAELQRAAFELPGVTSSQAVARISGGFDDALEQFFGILAIAAAAVLALALLIAFNANRITVDERRREHATMRAFGLPVRSVLAVVIKESVIIGLIATVIGLVAGLVVLDWMLQTLAETTLPDLGISSYLSPGTIVTAAAVGLVAVALAPLFLARRIQRMDIPDTLRVME